MAIAAKSRSSLHIGKCDFNKLVLKPSSYCELYILSAKLNILKFYLTAKAPMLDR